MTSVRTSTPFRPRIRQVGWTAAGLSLSLVALLASRVHDRSGPLNADRTASAFVDRRRIGSRLSHYRLGRLDSVHLLRSVQWLGSPIAITALTLIAILALLWRGDRAAAIATGGSVATAAFTAEKLLKPLVHRAAPHGGWYYPSGHATAIAALAAAVTIATARTNVKHGMVVGVVGSVVVAAVSLALVQLHAHYPSDVIGGVCLGSAFAIVAFLIAPSEAAWPATRGTDGPPGGR